jgi:hypothetical protein
MNEAPMNKGAELESPDARAGLVDGRRELARRLSGGLEITLYWCAGDNTTSVEVHQRASEETLLFAVAREHALDAFYHPFAHLPIAPEDCLVGTATGRAVAPR